MSLSDTALRAAKPQDQRYELKCGKGLFLVVGVSGEKSFVVRFKDRTGRSARKTIGTYPDLTLSKARDEAAAVKVAARKGEITAKVRGVSQVSLADDVLTVSAAFDLYYDHRAKSLSRPAVRRRNFEKDVEPHIGSKPLNGLTKDDCIDVLQRKHDALVAKGLTGRGVGNLHAELGAFLSWCAGSGYAFTRLQQNPLLGVPKIANAIERERFLSEREILWFFEALPSAGEFAAPIEFMLRSGMRRSEVMKLTKKMVVLENDLGPHLSLPVTKNGLPFILPLVGQLSALLPDLDGLGDDDNIWGLCDQALSKPMERLFKRFSEIATKAGANRVERWSLHDLRRTMSTQLNGMFQEDQVTPLVDEVVVERVLNHVPQGVKRIYNRWKYFPQRKAALSIWNLWLDGLTAKHDQ